MNQRDVNSNRVTGSPRITERAADVVRTGARDGRLADALGIEDRPSIASPLGRDTSDLETLRSSNEFTPQWGSTARERSVSAKTQSFRRGFDGEDSFFSALIRVDEDSSKKRLARIRVDVDQCQPTGVSCACL